MEERVHFRPLAEVDRQCVIVINLNGEDLSLIAVEHLVLQSEGLNLGRRVFFLKPDPVILNVTLLESRLDLERQLLVVEHPDLKQIFALVNALVVVNVDRELFLGRPSCAHRHLLDGADLLEIDKLDEQDLIEGNGRLVFWRWVSRNIKRDPPLDRLTADTAGIFGEEQENVTVRIPYEFLVFIGSRHKLGIHNDRLRHAVHSDAPVGQVELGVVMEHVGAKLHPVGDSETVEVLHDLPAQRIVGHVESRHTLGGCA